MSRTPRIRYLRQRRESRMRHSTRTNEWIDAQAARLGQTRDQIFELLREHDAQYVENLPTPAP